MKNPQNYEKTAEDQSPYSFLGILGLTLLLSVYSSPLWGQKSNQGNETDCERYSRILNEGCLRNFPLSTGAECNRIISRYKELRLGCRDTHTNRNRETPGERQVNFSSEGKRGNKESRGPEPVPASDITAETPPKSESQVNADSQGTAIHEASAASDSGKMSAIGAKSNITKGIPIAEELSSFGLGAANSHFDSLTAQYGGTEKMPPPVFDTYQNDLQVYSNAKSLYQEGKPIPQELVESARSPEIKSALELASAGAYLESELKEESKYLDYKINLFSGRVSELQKRNDFLKTHQDSRLTESGNPKKPADANRMPSQLGSSKSNITENVDQTSLAKILSELDPNAPHNQSLSGPEKRQLARKIEELRRKLRASVNNKTKGQTKDVLSDFQEELKNEKLVNLKNSPTENEGAWDDLIRQVELNSASPYPSSEEIEYTLRETSAEIGLLSGILETESQNLFQRVSDYYRNCEKRKCLNQ